ncbi:MAG: biopolymer transporter ExbD [Phycisphaerales bacterium]|nr:biopolymer transporter ExbD [Phycisphaerales bacterium]
MRFARRDAAEHVLAVDITSMIDVVFLLIIFFMATARFAQITRAEVELPRERGEQEEQSEEAGLVVNIDAEGRLIIDQHTVDMAELDGIVTQAIARLPGRKAEQLKLMIRADRNGNTAVLNAVVARLEAMGVGAARLATEVPR